MKNKNDSSESIYLDLNNFTEHKDGGKFLASKFFDFYDEAKAIPGKVIRIRRFGTTTKNERWRIFEDEVLKFVLEGNKLSKKERIFLRTIEGVNFLISQFKIGFKSMNELKARLKDKI